MKGIDVTIKRAASERMDCNKTNGKDLCDMSLLASFCRENALSL